MSNLQCKRSGVEHIFRNDEGIEALCCKMRSNALIGANELTEIKNQLSNGMRPEICAVCWNNEDRNLESWRQLGNKIYEDSHLYKKIEIIFDNTCDSKCIYCSATYSSQWDQEIKNTKFEIPKFACKNKVINNNDNTQYIIKYINQVGKQVPAGKTTAIVLLGGEPLLTTINKKNMLEICVNSFYKNNNKDNQLTVVLQTNCNTPELVLNKIIKNIKEYQKIYPNLFVVVSVSAESVGENYEYVRYGSSYDRFVKNLETWIKEGFWVGSNMSINAVSLIDTKKYFELFVELAKKHNIPARLSVNLVYSPKELSIGVLDKKFEYYLNDAISYVQNNKSVFEDYENIINNLTSFKSFIGTEKTYIPDLIKTVEYFRLQRGVDLKIVNKPLYNYLQKTDFQIK
jgi:hypothetical protein